MMVKTDRFAGQCELSRAWQNLGCWAIGLLQMCGVLLFSFNSYAVVSPYASRTAGSGIESETPILKSQIRFWESVFLKYSSSQVLIHDFDYPDMIIDVLDLEKSYANSNVANARKQDIQKRRIKDLLHHYQKAATNFKKYGKSAASLGPFEKRLLLIYGKDAQSLNNLISGQIQLRTQVGLHDSIKTAAKRAANYLETMEKIFAEESMPRILTRIAFVESMFDAKAKSKVGAFGMWQFMKPTGKRFLTIRNFIDERGSPFKATRAAARLLRENFAALGTWPLAITAYNHGVNGLKRARSTVRSSNLEDIIAKYKSRSFGFASKNFYAEFVAAAKVYDFLTRQKRVPEVVRDLEIIPIRLTKAIPVKRLLKAASTDVDELVRYNGCINERILRKNRNLILPANYTLYFPRRLAAVMMKEIEALEGPRYASNKNF